MSLSIVCAIVIFVYIRKNNKIFNTYVYPRVFRFKCEMRERDAKFRD